MLQLPPHVGAQVDTERRARARYTLDCCDNAVKRSRAERTLARLDARELRRRWAQDPFAPGSTLTIARQKDRDAITTLAARYGVIEGRRLTATGQPPSARCLDTVYWSCLRHLVGHFDETVLARKIKRAVLYDLHYLRRVGEVP